MKQKFAEGETETLIVKLTIKPDSPFHKSVGTASLTDLLSEHGISIDYDPCCYDECGMMDEDEWNERAADRVREMRER